MSRDQGSGVILFVAALVLAAPCIPAQSPAPPPARPHEISAALMPLPAVLRPGAGVARMDSAGHPVTLRPTENGLVCFRTPSTTDFDVRCYEQHFVEVVYRGFQLRAASVAPDSVGPRIEREIMAHAIVLPTQPTAGYRCFGPAIGYIAATDSIGPKIYCWQSVHFPFRTAREVGLPRMEDVADSLRARTPYVMASGSYWSHVMIEHP